MNVLGIDLGSREVKVAFMRNGTLAKKFKIGTMSFYRDYCTYKDKIVVDLNKLGIHKVDTAISTGYGRNNTDLNLFTAINEVKAHVYGAIFQTNLRNFILLDIGGQDIKIVRVQNGIITDLELNDKCAASCGRYLENMASVLEVPLEYLTGQVDNPTELNSTCAVFSESELIGKIAEGVSLDRLCAGVNYSLYKRLTPLLSKFSGHQLILSGGVAMGKAIQSLLRCNYDEVICVDDPQFNGVMGCCYFAELKRRNHLCIS